LVPNIPPPAAGMDPNSPPVEGVAVAATPNKPGRVAAVLAPNENAIILFLLFIFFKFLSLSIITNRQRF